MSKIIFHQQTVSFKGITIYKLFIKKAFHLKETLKKQKQKQKRQGCPLAKRQRGKPMQMKVQCLLHPATQDELKGFKYRPWTSPGVSRA